MSTAEEKDVMKARNDILRVVGRYSNFSGLRPHEQYAMEDAIDAILTESGIFDANEGKLSRIIESAVDDAMSGVSWRVRDAVKSALVKK